jgi:tetratricopeptide (TPR) repeat protein
MRTVPELIRRRWTVTRVVAFWVWVAGFYASVASAPRPAFAQKAAQAGFDEAWNKGQDFFNLGKYDEARVEFDKARGFSPRLPGPWRYLGKIAKIQERWQDCVDGYTEAIRLKPDSNNADEVRTDLEICRSSLGRPSFAGTLPKGFGALGVTASVEGARVEVDGIGKGATPLLPVPLVSGKHTVKVEKDGYLPMQLEVDVVVTIVVDVEVQLSVDPNAKPVKPHTEGATGDDVEVGWIVVATDASGSAVLIDGRVPPPGPQASYEATPGLHLLEVSAPGRDTYRRRIRVARGQKRTLSITMKSTAERVHENNVGYVFFGVAGVALASGIVFGLVENHKYEDARDAYTIEQERPPGSTVPPGVPEAHVTTRAEYEQMKDDAAKYALVSNISYGVAALAVGVSIYYFIAARPDERAGYPPTIAKRRSRLLPTVLAGGEGGVGAGLVYSGELGW